MPAFTVQIPDTANNYRIALTSHNLSDVAQQLPPAQACKSSDLCPNTSGDGGTAST